MKQGHILMDQPNYEENLRQEAEIWGRIAEEHAVEIPPDWKYRRYVRYNVLMYTAEIEALFKHIRPGMKVLELGCSSGWLTTGLARCGAETHGIDISESAINMARNYAETIKNEISGTLTYEVADLNTVELAEEQYDIITVKGTLHHLPNTKHLMNQIHHALKPGGLLWICDFDGDETLRTALAAGVFLFFLPTKVSYREKALGLLRFGVHSPSRVKMSMETEGLSPFEGAGREHDWLALTRKTFSIEREIRLPAITVFLEGEIKMGQRAGMLVLRVIRTLDRLMVRTHLICSTSVIVYARKQ
jgi:2-polyprenyl-6-hydroxyphenyl methylase/3-demethylubiquinone-9 3-methyltransferase